jgi:prepilin-type N-terminal cleavage/methylation domain-containing protein
MMLKKQKKLNNSSAFTLIELLIVIIIIGIIVSTISFNFTPNQLHLAADQLIKDIRYTQSLALKDDKYQPFPVENNATEYNRTKYWFKQWWHLKITDAGNELIYYIFTDSPRNTSTTNFDEKTVTKSQYEIELAKNANGKYLIGASKEETGNSNYPSQNEIDEQLNLTKKYGIKKIEFDGFTSSSSVYGPRIDILFDNCGNVFLDEGKKGDGDDINPMDSVRHLLNKNVTIKLCSDDSCNKCVAVIITPSGNVMKGSCNY